MTRVIESNEDCAYVHFDPSLVGQEPNDAQQAVIRNAPEIVLKSAFEQRSVQVEHLDAQRRVANLAVHTEISDKQTD